MFSRSKISSSLAVLFALAPLHLLAAVDIDPFGLLTPDVLVGKALVIPVSVTNPDNLPLSYSVTSSDPKIQARVKTGNPILRLHVKYAGAPASGNTPATPAFEGDLDFQLFRDIAPVTVGHISGFAQAGYYDNQIFHRVIKDFVAQGGDPAGNGTGVSNPGTPSATYIGLPFNFEHEFNPALIFVGLGQLAMANSSGGYNRGLTNGDRPQEVPAPQIGLGDFSATNGSQFFITTSSQHGNLDFKHTIFGQIVRGFSLLAQINTVPVGTSNKPTVDVKIVTAKILPGRSEATIFLGARAVGTSTVTLTAQDTLGNKSTRSFAATAKADTINTRPMMSRLPAAYANLNEFPSVRVNGIDLEGDRISFGIAAVRANLQTQQVDIEPNRIGYATIARQFGSTGTVGVDTFAVGASDYLGDTANAIPFADPTSREGEFAPFASYNWQVQRFIVGKKPVRIEAVPVNATAATAGTFVVAKFSDTDVAGTPGTYSAAINWGDGTAITAGVVARDNTRPGSGLFIISGTHTYAQPGTYTATAILTWNVPGLAQGQSAPEIERTRSSVVVATALTQLRAQGTTLEITGRKGLVGNRILATVTDINKGRRASDYSVTIDWGDGVLSNGAITKATPGRFVIRGNHTYRDPETFPVSIRIHPKAVTDESADAIAWTTLTMKGFVGTPHVPPFPISNLRATWRPSLDAGEGVSKVVTAGLVNPYDPANLAVQLRGVLEISNSGNKKAPPSLVRAYLSSDATLDKAGDKIDTRLKINGREQITVGAVAAGAIPNSGKTPWVVNLPKGESGGGKYLITEAVYSDPIVDANNVPKYSVIALPARIFGFDRSTNDFTTQDGATTVTFRVVLDTKPKANVTIPVTRSLPAQATVTPTTLTFTPDNYNVPQLVTVKGENDNNPNSVAYTVTIGTSTSTDPVLNGLPGFSLSLTNKP